jgi:hypothetical protein
MECRVSIRTFGRIRVLDWNEYSEPTLIGTIETKIPDLIDHISLKRLWSNPKTPLNLPKCFHLCSFAFPLIFVICFVFIWQINDATGNADRDNAFPLYEEGDVTKTKGLIVVLIADLNLSHATP